MEFPSQRFQFTLVQLRIFSTFCQTGSLTQTAAVLNLSQPAVSVQLRNFQDQFSLPLTEPRGRKLSITDFGLEIGRVVNQILDNVQGLVDTERGFRNLIQGRLRLAVASTGKYVMPFFLQGFLQINPGIDLEMDVTHKQAVLESLFSRKCDFALVSVLPESNEIDSLALVSNQLFLMGNEPLLMGNGPASLEIFRQIPLILREEGSATRQVMEDFFRVNKIPLRKALQLTSNEAVKQAVVAGLGYSILPWIGARNELQNQELHIVPVEGLPLRSEWNLIWLKNRLLPTAARGFLQYLEMEGPRIRKRFFGWAEENLHPG